MSRPDVLFPLFAELTSLDGVGPKVAKLFERIEIARPVDLLLTLPVAGIDRSLKSSIREAQLPGVVTVEVEIGLHQTPAIRGRPYRIHVRDALTEFQLVFFHRGPTGCAAPSPPASAASSRAGSRSSTASPRWSIPTTCFAPAAARPCRRSSRSTR